MTIVGLYVASGQDRGRLLHSQVVAVVKLDGRFATPGTVATLDQRGTIKGAQARECGYGQVWAFVEAQGPTVLYLFKNGRRAFDDCNFIVHSFSLLRRYHTTKGLV